MGAESAKIPLSKDRPRTEITDIQEKIVSLVTDTQKNTSDKEKTIRCFMNCLLVKSIISI